MNNSSSSSSNNGNGWPASPASSAFSATTVAPAGQQPASQQQQQYGRHLAGQGQDDESVYSRYEKWEDGQSQHASQHNNSDGFYSRPYENASGHFAGAGDPSYGAGANGSHVMLAHGSQAGHESIEMGYKGQQDQGYNQAYDQGHNQGYDQNYGQGYDQGGYGNGYGQPPPQGYPGGFQSGPQFDGGANQGYSPGGFVALAAPGTMIARPQPNVAAARSGGYGESYNEIKGRLMRKRTVKRVALTNGNLVLDVPIPSSLCRGSQAEEFTTTRYTAATCDPNDWISSRFTLRPWVMGRKTELAIVMTSYNEDEALLYNTLGAVMKNVAYLATRTRSKTWGADAWKKVVVFIIGDGRKKANDRMLKMLSCYGIFHEGAMKDHVLDKEVTAHIFELTTQVVVGPDGSVEVAKCPVQLVFCLKEKNQKKINSHRWFFNAFCKQLDPNVTVLLDVGTKPTGHSIYHLWKQFDKHPKVGGACGEIAVDVGTGGWRLINPLVASQNFEYKMSNILDKPLESVFGFIGVLPGAFSAYRWQALKGRPLEAYFKGEALHNGTLAGGSFINNLYLAEDRILCFELVTKTGEAWLLKYVKAARATTDVPDRVAELISQRRRWLNGSLFASIYAVFHWYRVWSSGQSFLRKLVLQVQMLYNLVQIIFTWTSLANFFLSMYFLMQSATSDSKKDPFGGQGEAVFEVCRNVYVALVVVVVVASLGSRPQGFNAMYTVCIVAFGTLFYLLLYCTGWTIYLQLDNAHLLTPGGWTGSHVVKLILNQSGIRSLVISIISTYVLWLLASIWMLDPWHMFTCMIQYLFLMPTYITILSIYSLANLHDVSWGTKGDNGAATDLGHAKAQKGKDGETVVEAKVPTSAADAEELWHHAQMDLAQPKKEEKQKRSQAVKESDHKQNFRTNFLLLWLGSNAFLVIFFTSTWWNHYTTVNLKLTTNPYLQALFWSTAVLAAIRASGSLLYIIFRLFGH